MIEIERRYKIKDIDMMTDRLQERGLTLRDEKRIVDEWFVPFEVDSREKHDVWFDEEHGVAYRIRKTVSSDDMQDIILDSKQHTAANDHNTFNEEVVLRGDEAAMRELLEEKGYYNWLTIDKTRRFFDSAWPEMHITMDTVSGVKQELGIDTVLEIEYSGDGTREQALAMIDEVATSLGLHADMLFEKSLTVESMQVLAKFR